ncbi:hypothetical protein [Methanobrevibacter millerae]|nr:hypothetical protein [Methanobrevibacter millerae]
MITTAACFIDGYLLMFDSISPISILKPLNLIWLSILPLISISPSSL